MSLKPWEIMQVSEAEQKAATVPALNCRGNSRQQLIRSIAENQNSQAHPSTTINILVMLFGFEAHNVVCLGGSFLT